MERTGPSYKENVKSILRMAHPPVGNSLIPIEGTLKFDLHPMLFMNSPYLDVINYELVIFVSYDVALISTS